MVARNFAIGLIKTKCSLVPHSAQLFWQTIRFLSVVWSTSWHWSLPVSLRISIRCMYVYMHLDNCKMPFWEHVTNTVLSQASWLELNLWCRQKLWGPAERFLHLGECWLLERHMCWKYRLVRFKVFVNRTLFERGNKIIMILNVDSVQMLPGTILCTFLLALNSVIILWLPKW